MNFYYILSLALSAIQLRAYPAARWLDTDKDGGERTACTRLFAFLFYLMMMIANRRRRCRRCCLR